MSDTKTISNPQPLGKRVLIQRLVPTAKAGNITLPDEALERVQAQIGEVVEVGNESELCLVPGDIVVYNKGAGLDVSHLFDSLTRARLIVLNDTDVIMKVQQSLLVTPF